MLVKDNILFKTKLVDCILNINSIKENGKQKEYDNTLVLKEKVIGQDYYTNKQSNIDVKLPSEIKENIFFC